ncbi:MAG: hypothetical protein ACLSWI_08725 [Candidatus Gastranaerophilaceae bacterium]
MEDEFRLDVKNITAQIKYLANVEGMNMTMLKFTINQLFDKKDSIRNLYNKMKNKTLRVSELAEIAEVLNYEIILKKKP